MAVQLSYCCSTRPSADTGLLPGRSAAEGACADWGVESCCIALHVPGVDPVVRSNWEQFVIPFSGVRVGRRGGRTATGWPREWAIKQYILENN